MKSVEYFMQKWSSYIIGKNQSSQKVEKFYNYKKKKNLCLIKLKISSSVPKFLNRWIWCSHQTAISFPTSNMSVPF
jgi:hypothetical protein